MRTRFDELRGIFCRSDARVPLGATKQRTQWIGELRRLLASVCLAALEPDLIILAELDFIHCRNAQCGKTPMKSRVMDISSSPSCGGT
jgi:hypothetical protein